MPTPAVGSTIKYSDVTTEFTLSVNPPPRAIGADFRFAGGTYTPASPAIPTGATATISLSGDLGRRTKVSASPLYSFDNFLFTSSNVSGQNGPTRAQFVTPPTPCYNPVYPAHIFAYPPDLVMNNSNKITAQPWYPTYWTLYNPGTGELPGYQVWTVPETATYTVIAAGAPGGDYAYSQPPSATMTTNQNRRYGGFGAILAGPFTFTRGQELIITIGQTGYGFAPSTGSYVVPNNTYIINGRGGGGATTIVDKANTSVPILIAGGGGGGASINGNVGYSSGYGQRSLILVKTSGIASTAGNDLGPGDNCTGAGFSVNSGNATPAKSWANGFTGGSNNATSNVANGGFGGGGTGGIDPGLNSKGGGGGGWGGGNGAGGEPGGAGYQLYSGGWGGTSYCTVSSNIANTPIYGNFWGLGTNGSNLTVVHGSIPYGMCWIKKVTELNTQFTITFDDFGGYLVGPVTQQTSLLTSFLAARTSQPAYSYTLPYWFGWNPNVVAWVVPKDGQYKLTAAGGSGDLSYNATLGGPRLAGGRGLVVTATYYLMKGDVLIFSVGQRAYGGQNGNAAGANANLGFGGAGGSTAIMRNGLIADNNTINSSTPGFPLLCAAGGSGGAAQAAGSDADPTLVTGTATPGNNNIGGASTNCGACFYTCGGRNSSVISNAVGTDWKLNNNSCLYGIGGANGGGNGWGGGGRGSTNNALAGGGAGWQGANGSQSTTTFTFAATSYYWSGTGYVAGSVTSSYNAAVVSGSGSTGGGYVTIQQL